MPKYNLLVEVRLSSLLDPASLVIEAESIAEQFIGEHPEFDVHDICARTRRPWARHARTAYFEVREALAMAWLDYLEERDLIRKSRRVLQ